MPRAKKRGPATATAAPPEPDAASLPASGSVYPPPEKPTPIPSYTWVDLDLDVIEIAPWNYKTNDPELEQRLEASFRTHGQVESCMVRQLDGGRYEMVNGNHRLRVARRLVAEGAIGRTLHCCDVGDVTVQQAILMALSTNSIAFADDRRLLAITLKELSEAYDLDHITQVTAYKEPDISKLLDLAAPPVAPDQFPAFDEDIDTDYCCPKCGYEWSGAPK